MILRSLMVVAVLVTLPPACPRSAPPVGPPGASWALRYYTLRGAAVDFLVREPSALAKGLHGRAVVLKNETYHTLANLVNRFGTRFNSARFGEGSRFLDAKTGAPVGADSPLGKPFFAADSHLAAGVFPSARSSVDDLKQILRGGPGWMVAVSHEGSGKSGEIGRVMFWHSANGTSVTHLAQTDEARQIVKLMRLVTGGRFPFGFFLVNHSATLQGCGPLELSDLALPRYVDVRVAVLENNTGNGLNISGLRGVRNTSDALRLAASDDRRLSGAPAALAMGQGLTLEAGSRLIIPLRIAFSFSDYAIASPYSSDLAMVAKPPGKSEIQRFLREFNKWKRLGFDLSKRPLDERDPAKQAVIGYSTLAAIARRPWRDPHVKEDFIYGPSYRVTAAIVKSGPSSGGPRKSQSLDYTTAGGYGSCPFVSVWDSQKKLWVEYGRVLIGAAGPGAQRQEVYDLPSAPPEVEISEKEPEETHLAQLYLEIDGVRLRPSCSASATVLEGERRIFHFSVPKALRARRARLHLSGYYIRRPRIRLKPA